MTEKLERSMIQGQSLDQIWCKWKGEVRVKHHGSFQALQPTKAFKFVSGENLYGHQHSAEWMLLHEGSFISAANINQIPHVEIDSLEFVVTRARPRHIEGPKRAIIYSTTICFKNNM